MAKKKITETDAAVESPSTPPPPGAPRLVRRRTPRASSAEEGAQRAVAAQTGATPISSERGAPISVRTPKAPPARTAKATPRGSVTGGNGTPAHSPTYEEIAEAAYHRYLSRGAGHGNDLNDWIEAEQELRQRPRGR
jgi:hypothetical protein